MRIPSLPAAATASLTAPAPTVSIRSDFRKALEQKLNQDLTMPGQPKPQTDITQLPASTQRELRRLQTASEGFESHFVKQILDEARKASLDPEKSGMGDFAKDMMNQTLADSTSQSGTGLGLGKSIFISMGEHVVRSSPSARQTVQHSNSQTSIVSK